MATKSNAEKGGGTRGQKAAGAPRSSRSHPKRPYPYTGDLAKPLDLSPLAMCAMAIGTPLDVSLPSGTPVAVERARRLMLLFDWHGVDLGDWCGLAVKLADAHVPGLQISGPRPRRGRPPTFKAAPKRTGRPVLWDDASLRDLVYMADDWKRRQRERGEERTPDIAFVRFLLNLFEPGTEKQAASKRKKAEHKYAIQLSRARQVVSKTY